MIFTTVIAAIALFMGVEIGYVWAGGMPETPQTWIVVGILAVLLVLTAALAQRRVTK